jgi:hypothetical protein
MLFAPLFQSLFCSHIKKGPFMLSNMKQYCTADRSEVTIMLNQCTAKAVSSLENHVTSDI